MNSDLKKLHEMFVFGESYAAEMELDKNKNRSDLVQQFINTSNEIEMFRKKEHIEKQKLDAVVDEEYGNDLENLSRAYGWQITENKALENNKIQITMHYNKSHCFIKLTKNGSFDLLQVYPELPSFALIKELLNQSQDLSALLRVCKKLFSINKSTSAHATFNYGLCIMTFCMLRCLSLKFLS